MMERCGFLNINKPSGMTSFEVVSKVKRILGTKKVGHLGTIDKAGSGVLPIAVGSATKFFDYFLSKDKEYLAYFKFGEQTDTLDSYGTITCKSSKVVEEKELEMAAKMMVGEQMQLPPQYSAVKVGGKRASDRTLSGESVELKPRRIVIYSFDIVKKLDLNLFLVKIHCSAGTYIRSIMRDIAHALGTCGTMIGIIRTRSGKFEIQNSITIDEISWEKLISPKDVVASDEIENTKLKRLLMDNNE